MAISIGNKPETTGAAAAANQGTGAPNNATGGFFPNTPAAGLSLLAELYGGISSLTATAEEFLKKVDETLEAMAAQNTASTVYQTTEKVVISRVNVGIAGFTAYAYKGKAFLVGIGETIPTTEWKGVRMPPAAALANAITALSNRKEPLSVVSSAIITPDSYPDRAGILARDIYLDICNAIFPSPVKVDMKMMRDTRQFNLSHDTKRIADFLHQNSPHGMRPRIDIAAAWTPASLQQLMHNGSAWGQQMNYNQLDMAAFGSNMNKPAIAVGAYVTFQPIFPYQFGQLGLNGGIPGMGMGMMGQTNMMEQMRFIPMIHITDIYVLGRVPNLLSAAFMLASDAFITRGLWKNQFASFGLKGAENIGNLLRSPDEKGNLRPYRVTSPQELEQFVMCYCTQPVMVIHLTEGRSRLPSLQRLLSQPAGATATAATTKEIGGFLSSDENNPVQFPCAFADIQSMSIIGAIPYRTGSSTASTQMDSRYVDLLTLVANDEKRASNPDTKIYYDSLMTSRMFDAHEKMVSEFIGPDAFNPLYFDYSAIVNPQAMNVLLSSTSGQISVDGSNGIGNNFIQADLMAKFILTPGVSSTFYQGMGMRMGTTPVAGIGNYYY